MNVYKDPCGNDCNEENVGGGPKFQNSLQTAAEAMNIVDAGIENNHLDEISGLLEDLRIREGEPDQYVFYTGGTAIHTLSVIFAFLFSIVFDLIMFLSLNTLILTDLFNKIAAGMLVTSITALIANIVIILVVCNSILYNMRYKKYYALLKNHRIESVDDISEFAGYKKKKVIKDLKKAIQKKYIPEGHFGRNSFLFIVSDEIYYKYQRIPAIFDHYFMNKIQNRERMMSHNAEIQSILKTGQLYIEKIHDSNDIIKDKVISDKLTQMEKTVTTIFKEVDLHPEQSQKLGLFLNYYLPTTDKLLKNYISLTEKEAGSRSVSSILCELTKSLDKINSAFDKILELLYIEQESDIISDIQAMETVMSNEGLL